MLKLIVAAAWLLIVFNLISPFDGLTGQILFWLGPILLIAHLIEYFVFAKKIKAKEDSAAKSFLMTMIFGVVYFGS